MNVRHRLVSIAGLIAASTLGLVLACTKIQSGPAQLQVKMVDAPPLGVDQIIVHVTKVTAHSNTDGWIPVSDTPFKVDLLTLQTTPLPIGLVKLSGSRITQLRLYVTKDDNWVHVTGDVPGHLTPLFVPSGYESGIKIHGPWRADECTRTSVTIDFDGAASIWAHDTGNGIQWILRPVIRFKKADTTPVECGDDGEKPATCDNESSPCAEGQVCSSGTCVDDGGPGRGAGDSCTSHDDCLSANCVVGAGGGGTCDQSPPNGPCVVDGDCTNGACDETEGSCAPCAQPTDCPAGLTCVAGQCTEPTGL
jgi:Domain of unknown function (DUF4382)